jgi:hypothetical protein
MLLQLYIGCMHARALRHGKLSLVQQAQDHDGIDKTRGRWKKRLAIVPQQ